MQDFCDKLVVLIGEAPDPQTSTELSRILSRCKEGEGEAVPQSGGHGPRPPIKPPEDPEPGTLRSGGHGPRPPQAE